MSTTQSSPSNSSQIVTLPDLPELYNPNFLDVLLPPSPETPAKAATTPDAPSNPMIDALKATSVQTLTANNAAAYSSTNSPTLDAFHNISFDFLTQTETKQHLDRAWKEDPELTLRIIWNARSIHEGKGSRQAFYSAFGWLYEYHPRTAIANLGRLVDLVCMRPHTDEGLSHGYWKDLLSILVLAILDQLGSDEPPAYLGRRKREEVDRSWYKRRRLARKMRGPLDETARKEKAEEHMRAAKDKRVQGYQSSHELLLAKLSIPKFRALYIAVARLFAERLTQDIRILNDIEALPPAEDRVPYYKKLSLAGKWAPTPHASHDRHTNISTAISRLLYHSSSNFPQSFPATLATASDPIQSQILRSYFQRWVLTPLRSALLVTEKYMTSNQWGDIRYDRVSSTCMKNNTGTFLKHDKERFEKFLAEVETGTKKISGATLMPHVLLGRLLEYSDAMESRANKNVQRKILAKTQLRVIEGQWKTLVGRLRESGALDNSLAVCDVSGSMGSLDAWSSRNETNPQPIFVSVALSLIVAQLAMPPFDNGFITFATRPQFIQLNPDNGLLASVRAMETAYWSMSTNLEAVFLKLLLPLALKNAVKPEDMIKRLFVFTDMQFDEGSTSKEAAEWKTTHDVIENAYKEAGYDVPQIVYWDLSRQRKKTSPVGAEREGVALMSGFSPAMLKVFMGEQEETEEEWEKVDQPGEEDEMVVDSDGDEKEQFTPLEVMKKALMKKCFDGLVVLD